MRYDRILDSLPEPLSYMSAVLLGSHQAIDLIVLFVAEEKWHAREIFSLLDIPLKILVPATEARLSESVQDLFNMGQNRARR